MMNICAPVIFANAAIQRTYSSPVILANAGIQKVLSLARRPRVCGDPEVCLGLDSRLRGNDVMGGVV